MVRKELHEENRRSWNAATVAHNSHKGDQAAFFRAGGNKLYPEERELLGDLAGLTVVHLQCNAGQDTLSLVRLGATVTGVDISDEAIDFARRLAADAGMQADFVRADIYDWLAEATAGDTRFDVAFCSYGAICWLSDLRPWARGIAATLKPGGRFVMVDFHPVAMMFDEDLVRTGPYFAEGQALPSEGVGDYVAVSGDPLASPDVEGVKDFKNPYRAHEFQWGVGEIVTVLLEAGLALAAFREYPYANSFKPYKEMREGPRHRFSMPEGVPNLPLMYAIAARKP